MLVQCPKCEVMIPTALGIMHDDVSAERDRLREELDSLNHLYVACRDDYERIWGVLEEIAGGYERHNPGWWIKKAKAALGSAASPRKDQT